jgi:hypothetical protein
MDDRKFTPPTEFPAEYVDSNGDKAVILGRGPHKVFPFIGHNAAGYARYWTEKGTFSSLGINGFDLHDIPKRITTWHNVYQDATLGYNSFTSRDQTFPHSVGLKGLCVYRIERDVDGGNPEIFVEDV